jgi:hypothetical protein
MTSLRALSTISLATLFVACGDRQASPRSATPLDSTEASAGSIPDSADHSETTTARPGAKPAPKKAGKTTAKPSDSAAKSRGKSTPDSAILLQIATQPKLRTIADSISLVASIRAGLKHEGWPVKTAAPLAGSILPHKRIVAYYGNPLSKKMGILGEIPYDAMLSKLDSTVALWRAADPSLPVQPALHLIVSVAQGLPGKDSMYRQRSDPDLIEKVYGLARSHGAITILDVQAGKSTLQAELPVIERFLSRPDVHLGVDPEFYMHHNREGRAPGTKIGAMTAADINGVIEFLASLVTKYHLPPKVLVVHRFTTNMLQDAEQIRLDPRVQVVINMDGWGQPWLKFDTYARCEVAEPVQFTGFKLFYHNDTRKGDPLLSPREVLALRPRPIYIQYQ